MSNQVKKSLTTSSSPWCTDTIWLSTNRDKGRPRDGTTPSHARWTIQKLNCNSRVTSNSGQTQKGKTSIRDRQGRTLKQHGSCSLEGSSGCPRNTSLRTKGHMKFESHADVIRHKELIDCAKRWRAEHRLSESTWEMMHKKGHGW